MKISDAKTEEKNGKEIGKVEKCRTVERERETKK